MSTLHYIGHIVEKEKNGVVLNHHFIVMTLVQGDSEEKYQRFILARTWTGLIKGGMFSFIL